MITLIWQANKEVSWETDWIEYLFRNVTHNTITDYQLNTEIDNCVIIYNSTVNNSDYIKNLYDKGITFGLIHLSDEWYRDPVDNYSLAKFVIRNFCGNYGPNVHVFPVGCISTYPYGLITNTVKQRQYTWSFSGHVDKSNRHEMTQYMTTVPNGKSYFKNCGEYVGYALTPVQLWDMYNDSLFMPCPNGNFVMESFRLCEALQAGSLPIVERGDYWTQLYGDDHPLIQVDHWSQAPTVIEHLMTDLDALELQRYETHQWWLKHCDKLIETVTHLSNTYLRNV